MASEIADVANFPINSGGASFTTHNLITANTRKLVFKPTLMSYLFAAVFCVIGLAVFLAFGFAMFETKDYSFGIGSIIGLLFSGIGYWLLKHMAYERAVDLSTNSLIIPSKAFSLKPETEIISFDSIQAFQIIEKRIHGSEHSYDSYELNLVLNDGSRKNIVDHAGGSQLLQEAQTLARYVGCKVLVDANLGH